ncbi:hypothetical protein LCGC14_2884560 [marine sediment metagenome]|uniref:Uncharacterized protein n=1 Tax=marine sediment metagenome TaxID=412755 RepID=A0A0F8YKZ3_9ZZZZ
MKTTEIKKEEVESTKVEEIETTNKELEIVSNKELENILSAEEKAVFVKCEAIISASIDSYYAVGLALLDIRDGKLYREHFKTFEIYCESVWDRSRQSGYNQMERVRIINGMGGEKKVIELANNCGQKFPNQYYIDIIKKGFSDGDLQFKVLKIANLKAKDEKRSARGNDYIKAIETQKAIIQQEKDKAKIEKHNDKVTEKEKELKVLETAKKKEVNRIKDAERKKKENHVNPPISEINITIIIK